MGREEAVKVTGAKVVEIKKRGKRKGVLRGRRRKRG